MRVYIRVNLGRYFERRAGPSLTAVTDGDRAAQLSALRTQIESLSRQRRSSSEFRPWKADVFYYLFSAVGSASVPWLTEAPSVGFSARGMVVTVLCFALLCCAPPAANELRYWVDFLRPNRRLRRQIALLQAEMERLQGSPKSTLRDSQDQKFGT